MNTLLSPSPSSYALVPRRVCGLKPASFPVRRFTGERALWQRTAGMAVWVLLGLLALAGLPQAQGAGPSVIETRLHSFGDPLTDAAYTSAPVTEGSDGKLYGTTRQGGLGYGTVFRVNKDGSGFAVLKSLDGGADGVSPCGAVTEGSDGALYGTANGGGSFGSGTVFRVNKDGSSFAVLKNLSYATDGSSPQAGVIEGSDGALYGTTSGGGSLGYGTVFRVNKNGSGFAVLRTLNGSTDGRNPQAGVIEGSDGALYGTAYSGGGMGNGTVFRVGKDGSGFAVLRSLNGATDGRYPYGAVTEGSDGALYGTAIGGGSMGNGTVFRVNKNGSGFTVLKNFSYSTDGAAPYGAVTEGSDGALYGTTYSGGSMGNGTVFRVNKDGGGFAVLRTLNGATDGRNAYAGVTEGSDGALYGTTYSGGGMGYGTVFRVNKDGTGFTVLKNLTGGADGANPFVGVTEGSDGVLYGTAYSGGSMGYGCVFRMNKDGGGFAVLKSLNGGTDGANPYARLTEGSDGALYGTAYSGGASSAGTVFRVNKDGSGFTVLKNLSYATDGGNPSAAVIEGSDGALYGTAYTGGSMGNGTVFRLNKDGSGFTVLRSLNGGTDGRSPFAGLTEGSDGALYGTANGGGSFDNGTVFRVNKNGSGFTVLRSLNGGTDGANPYAPVAEGSDGALYGTAPFRGSMGYGTVFRVNKDGSGFTVLRHLSYFTDGANPYAALTEGSDGALYGTAIGGGSWGYGTVFRVNKDGSGFELLQAFGGAAGGPRNPRGQLLRGNDARLYGTSGQGGDANVGTVFALEIVVPNEPPVAGDDTYSVAEDTTLTVSAPGVLGNDNDPEAAILTASVATPPAHGALTLHADGSFYYTPSGNYHGPDSFTYTVSDPAGKTAGATVNLTINPVDDPTVLAADAANVVVNEGSPATMTGTFSDVEGNDGILLTASVGTITQDNLAGTWSWTHTPTEGSSSIQVLVTAHDGGNPPVTTSFAVDVLNVPPSLDLGPDVTVPPAANGLFVVFGGVSFADPGDDLWSIYINYGDGSPTEQFSSQRDVRSFGLQHHYAASGIYTVTVDVSDGLSTATDTLQVTVQRNSAPVAGADSANRPNNTRVVKVLKTALLANDTDADLDPRTITAVGHALPAGSTVVLSGGFVIYTAPANNSGNGSYEYTLSDGPGGHAVTGSVAITEVAVVPPNPPPNAANIAVAPNGDVVLTFVVAPGRQYRVQYAAGSQPYAWQEFSPQAIYTPAPNGVITHTDPNPPAPMRVYRLITHP